MLKVYAITCASICFMAMTGDKPAYVLYDKNGGKVSYNDMVEGLAAADVILFGEYHNNPICHWLQLQVAASLYEDKGENLVLGAEMFEADAQLVLDEYLAGHIKAQHFENEGKVWKNHKTDYAPLVDFAKNHGLPFVATNVPRRYANLVARETLEGLEKLSGPAKKLMVPLPFTVDLELPGYKNMRDMMQGHGGTGMVEAQALKDATMAHFIAQHAGNGKIFLHFNGAYHSNNFEGIYWHLKKAKPGLTVKTVSASEQAAVAQLDSTALGLADFIIAIPKDMTKTY